ncbi:putative methyltransferase At1g22800, mitochondrial [Nymphon striatum]|nr:putative methyltransferase At1g22800, mitochondrial [Nymphon striatum]
MSIKNIIDKNQLKANVVRAHRMNVAGSDFLLMRILDDLADRLATHTRKFENGSVICPWADHIQNVGSFSEKLSSINLLKIESSAWHTELLEAAVNSEEIVFDITNLHRTNDVPGMLVQYNRVLKPDGLFLGCVPGGDTLFELRQSLAFAESEVCGGISPRVLPFMDVRDAGGLLQRAGFALPVADIDTVVVRYDSVFDLMLDLRAMGETNVLMDRTKRFTRKALFQKAAQYYAENFSDKDGRIRATFSFIWMSGWAPDASQPKPLKPGSAKMSLVDALKKNNIE